MMSRAERQTNIQTDRQTNKHTDRQTDRQTDRRKNIENALGQKDKHTHDKKT